MNASEPVHFSCGVTSKNRLMLAPMTNTQSHKDGTLSDDEYRWLTMRAKGGFGITMTCASHVQKSGQGFPGQLGIFSDDHIDGHQKLSSGIKAYDSIAVLQLHHAGMRSPEELIGEKPLCPSADVKHGARAMSLAEIVELRNSFIDAAVRARDCGYDGIEVHGAHGYILSQFLSSDINKRTDSYGGSLENRSRLLFEIVEGIRAKCGSDFLLGVRLSPERFGMRLGEVKEVAMQLINENNIDFLDISLWDYQKQPVEDSNQQVTLLEHFTKLKRGDIRLTIAGNIRTGKDVHQVLSSGVDFVTVGRAAILHHDFAQRVIHDKTFVPIALPVNTEYLRAEGLGDSFIQYMQKWKGFVDK